MKKSSTIRDVAKAAGVSLGTASQALNDKPGVSLETMKKVKEAAEAINYIPSITAKQFRDKKSNIISMHIVVSDEGEIHPSTWAFYFPIIKGFTNKLSKNNYKLHLEFNTIQDISEKDTLLKYIRGYNIQGAAFIIAANGDYSGLLRFKEYSIPIVTIYTKVYNSISSIFIDNNNAAFNVVTWLRRLGHEKIAFIGGPSSDFAAVERKNGYLKGMKGNRSVYTIDGTWDIESGNRILKKILSDGFMPTAIFCANDHMAMGVLNACRDLRIKIPDTISLIGFDDNIICQVSDPQLTSVRMPLFELGEKAAKALISDLDVKKPEPQHTLLPAQLIVRNSVISLSHNKNQLSE